MLGRLLPLLVALAAAPSAPGGGGGPVAHGGPGGRLALNGPWTVRIDPFARGTAKGFHAGAFRGRTVRAPFSPNAVGFTGRRSLAVFSGTVGWYRTSFTVPEDRSYVLRFESVNHRATVWLDGRRVRTHTGGYLPFEVVAPMRANRRHVLVVRADWRDPLRMKREGWHRSWFNFGGINREVTIRPAGSSEVVSPTIRTRLTSGGDALVDVSARVRNRGAGRTLALMGALVRDGDRIPLRFPAVTVPAGRERVVRAQVRIAGPALWAPGHPELYDLQLYVPGESSWHSNVGLREIRRAGARLLLNGRRLVLRGASIQEDAPGHGDALTASDMDAIVARLRRIHANATRVQHPLSPALVERLDAAGILIWQGVGPVDAPGNWVEVTPRMRRVARERVRTSVAQLQTHPSILAWNLANEVAGQGHPGGQAGYIDGMARELRRADPGRPIALDIWGTHPPTSNGLMYRHVDILGLTNYVGWYESTYASPARVAQVIRSKVAALRRAFPGRAIVVTEFGAEASGRNPSLRPGGYGFQARLLATHIHTYRGIPALSGMLVWALDDFAVSPRFVGGSIRRLVPAIRLVRGLNQKGLFTYGGRAKPAAAVVARAFATMRSP
jgi:hypothetical protein